MHSNCFINLGSIHVTLLSRTSQTLAKYDNGVLKYEGSGEETLSRKYERKIQRTHIFLAIKTMLTIFNNIHATMITMKNYKAL